MHVDLFEVQSVNTPAHIVLNAYALGRGRFARFPWPIAFGAILPDLPMLLFYLYQRGWLGVPESAIWSQAYFLPNWQSLFDAFNSLPLIGLGAVLAWRTKRYAWLAGLASMALHSGADFLLHHEDAHGHFWPHPCCIKTKLPIGNLVEEKLLDILDSLRGDPVYEAINAGQPQRMGLAEGWSESRFLEASRTTTPKGRRYENLCIGCDRFHEEVLAPRVAAARERRRLARARD